MHRTAAAFGAGVAALVFAAPEPASATTTAPAVHYGETDAGFMQEVGKKQKKWKDHDHDVYVYSDRRRYRPYAYDDYDYDYHEYRRRPGVNLHLDF
jgi:hypothetical protein